jgi:hypothetical protein
MSVCGSKLRWWIDPMGVIIPTLCLYLHSVALNRLLRMT